MSIKTTVEGICLRYNTRNPFEIAKQRNIIVLYEPLANVRGYYNRCYRQQFIHINQDLDKRQQLFTCAHELGHAILHPKANTPFLRENTLFSINKLEIEANRFAACTLYSDSELLEYREFTVKQVAQCLGLSEDLVKYRFNTIE